MIVKTDVPLSSWTTFRIGGPATAMVDVYEDREVVEAVEWAKTQGTPLLVLGGGSNLLVADGGFAGAVLRMASRGVRIDDDGPLVRLEVQAGESWDALVDRCVDEGFSGIEALSGIPGLVGATPIQNVGAYGQEVADVIESVKVLDRATCEVRTWSKAECGFGYRTSRFKTEPHRYIVLSVTFLLRDDPLGTPLVYDELAKSLRAPKGSRQPLGAVREAVLALRKSKSMVVSEADPESRSAGSFFMNPVLGEDEFRSLSERVVALGMVSEASAIPTFAVESGPGKGAGRVKVPAAWLVERAGFPKGTGNARVGVGRHHALAIVNRGGASAADVVAFARKIQSAVREKFGVLLEPEPVFVGLPPL